MKTKNIFILILIAALNPFGFINAQSDSTKTDRDKAMRYAYRNLNGIGVQLNYKKAFFIFNKLAKSGDGEACNALGMMYKLGLGVEQNDTIALRLFNAAAKNGYAKGAYNAGLIYKYGHGVEQDWEKSAQLIDSANTMGMKRTDYAIAYSYYRGQGRKQDYKKAAEHFKQGAESGDAACMFNLGYCYFRGHGVERSPEQGKYWIEKAADKGLTRAVDFIARENSKTFGQPKVRLRSSDGVSNHIPSVRRTVENTTDNSGIVGEWEGWLVTYDWSGQEIEEETPLKVVFEADNNTLIGFWIENDTNPIVINAVQEDSQWTFNNTLLYKGKRALQMSKGSFKLEAKDGEELLTGNVSIYSETVKEYTQPNYIVLKRSNAQSSISETTVNGINVSPNPFKDILNVRFTLQKEDEVSIKIFDMSGRNIYGDNRQACSLGDNHLTVNASSFSSGSYVLQIVGETINYSTIIIK